MSERLLTPFIMIALFLGTLWAVHAISSKSAPVTPGAGSPTVALAPDMIPLVTGDEPVSEIFTKAGCAVCHTVPGIAGAEGRVGPPLIVGTTGPGRLADPSYRGHAQTVHDYVIESVLEPGVFVVPGYPAGTMPTWYGAKLSGLALEKIAAYLALQTAAQ